MPKDRNGYEYITDREVRSGRCRDCQHGRSGPPIIYQWEIGAGRELYRAHCPGCGGRLSQTCVNNLKDPIVGAGDVAFAPDKACETCEGTGVLGEDWAEVGQQGDRCISCKGSRTQVDYDNVKFNDEAGVPLLRYKRSIQ